MTRKVPHQRRSGVLFHAKHAFQPNILGYCGPDDGRTILEHLHSSSTSEKLTETLEKFQAAYPFVRMIAKSSGCTPFDFEVAEAYWIGNSLLRNVSPTEFFEFAHQGLSSPMPKKDAKTLFKEIGAIAKPHHTFYVLGMYSKRNPQAGNEEKLLKLMDSCRISWGKVEKVKEKTLIVERTPLVIHEGQLSFGAKPVRKEVDYDCEIRPFPTVKEGDWVSLHWNFACEKLTQIQLHNLIMYSNVDAIAANRFADLQSKRKD